MYLARYMVTQSRGTNSQTEDIKTGSSPDRLPEICTPGRVGSEFMEAGRTHILMERQVD